MTIQATQPPSRLWLRWAALIGAALMLALLLAACGDEADEETAGVEGAPAAGGASTLPPAPIETAVIDCRSDNGHCPEILIGGDPWQEPIDGILSLRGYADPSVRLDPATGRLWLTYTSVRSRDVGAETAGRFLTTHLAYSDDSGVSWQFERALNNPVEAAGGAIVSYEVSTITLLGGDGATPRWYYGELRYLRNAETRDLLPPTVHYRLRTAVTAPALATAPDVGYRGLALDPSTETGLDLTAVVEDAGHPRCRVWTEPELFAEAGRLYLLAECQDGFTVLLASPPAEHIADLRWEVLGRIDQLGPEFGAEEFTQATLARSRDGALLLIGTPSFHNSPVHLGCRVVELESLDPLRLRRHPDGSLVVRAEILSTDGEPNGPGACAYDPASETGVLFVRRAFDFPNLDVRFHLVATGIHP